MYRLGTRSRGVLLVPLALVLACHASGAGAPPDVAGAPRVEAPSRVDSPAYVPAACASRPTPKASTLLPVDAPWRPPCAEWDCMRESYGPFLDPSVLRSDGEVLFGTRWGRLVALGNGVVPSDVFTRAISATGSQPLPGVTGLPDAALRERLLAALGLTKLLAGFASRPLAVVRHAMSVYDGWREELVWVEDRIGEISTVGTLEVRLFLPPASMPGPYPAVLALHGHGENPGDAARELFAVELAKKGIAVALPHQRTLAETGLDTYLAGPLLRSGFTLKGLQVFEAAMAEKLLRGLPEVDRGHLGALCHSGGCSVLNPWLRLSDAYAIAETDMLSTYRSPEGGRVHCDDVPALVPLWADVSLPPKDDVDGNEAGERWISALIRDQIPDGGGGSTQRRLLPYPIGRSPFAVRELERCLVEGRCCGGAEARSAAP